MLQQELTKEQVLYIAENLLSFLNPASENDIALFDQAYQLYRQGNIYNSNVEEDLIHATVYDQQEFFVTIDMNFFQLSDCTCPSTTLICRHKLAAFFYVYAGFSLLGEFIRTWKNLVDRKEFDKQQKMLQQKHKDLRQQPSHAPAAIESWLSDFEQIYETFSYEANVELSSFTGSYKQRLFIEKIATHYYPMLLAQPAEHALHALYTIHVGITALKKISDFITEQTVTDNSINFSFSPVRQLVGQIEEAIGKASKTFLPPRYGHLLEDSIDRFDVLLDVHEAYSFFGALIYRMLWGSLLNRKEWIARKEEDLSKRWKNSQDDQVTVRAALVFFAYLQEDDERAMEEAKAIPNGAIPYLFYMIEHAESTNQSERMLDWLDFVKDRFKPLLTLPGEFQWKRECCDYLLSSYQRHAEETNAPHVYINAMKDLLPYSFYEYNQYLLSRHQYREWAELQMLVGFRPEVYDRHMLSEIEKRDRTCLIPLYHQAVEQAIAEKNRNAYKLAVKRLKKLRTHYRQLKKSDKWETYVALLTNKYKRLRAFQEELKKGKLIDD